MYIIKGFPDVVTNIFINFLETMFMGMSMLGFLGPLIDFQEKLRGPPRDLFSTSGGTIFETPTNSIAKTNEIIL